MVLFDNFYTTITYKPYKDCEIIAIPVAYFPVQFAYGFQKKSPYFDLFWRHVSQEHDHKLLDTYSKENF